MYELTNLFIKMPALRGPQTGKENVSLLGIAESCYFKARLKSESYDRFYGGKHKRAAPKGKKRFLLRSGLENVRLYVRGSNHSF